MARAELGQQGHPVLAEYSIFALGESHMTISGGAQLDGVTQGDGSHLVGQTITLDSDAWAPIALTDDDSDFRDNDMSQRLDGAQSFDGVGYANGTIVEAEYGLTLSDGVNSWEVVGFNLHNSSTSYATVEGLAFIGGPGGFPPVGVPLTVVSARDFPDFQVADYATPICYDAATLIDTEAGRRPIRTLRVGDRVRTLDNGLQPVRWVGARRGNGLGPGAPIEIATGMLGAIAPLRVSRQHRLLLRTAQAELMFGTAEVFAAAGHLQDGVTIRSLQGLGTTWMHLLLDRHEVIFANGVASESLYLGPALAGTGPFFTDLPRDSGCARRLARPQLRRDEAALLRPTPTLARAG